jgi:opacity protein-like surface antigen
MLLRCLAALLLLATPAWAQTPAERLPWFAIDLHAGTVGLPQAEGWVPVVSVDTELPGRAWGAGVGGTIYPLRMGIMTLGVGASFTTARGKSESLTIRSGSGSTATTRVTPAVRTSITNLAPQLSINFGQKLGWSYLSAGAGRSKVTSSADAVGVTPGIVVPDSWNSALNFGGGARWFMKPRLGAGFDVRFVKLGSRSATNMLPAAKRTQMWTISAGITLQ